MSGGEPSDLQMLGPRHHEWVRVRRAGEQFPTDGRDPDIQVFTWVPNHRQVAKL